MAPFPLYWLGPDATVRTTGRVVVKIDSGSARDNLATARDIVRDLNRNTGLLDTLEAGVALILIIESSTAEA